jgi:hypothetical protein
MTRPAVAHSAFFLFFQFFPTRHLAPKFAADSSQCSVFSGGSVNFEAQNQFLGRQAFSSCKETEHELHDSDRWWQCTPKTQPNNAEKVYKTYVLF